MRSPKMTVAGAGLVGDLQQRCRLLVYRSWEPSGYDGSADQYLSGGACFVQTYPEIWQTNGSFGWYLRIFSQQKAPEFLVAGDWKWHYSPGKEGFPNQKSLCSHHNFHKKPTFPHFQGSRKPLRHDGTEKRSILSLWVLVPLEGTKMLVSGCRRFHHFSEGVGLHSTWKSCIPMSIKHTWNHKNLRRCLDVYTKCHCTFFVHWFIWRRLWIENVWEHEYSNQEVWKNCYQQWSHDGTIKMSTTTTLILIFCWQQGGHFTTKKNVFLFRIPGLLSTWWRYISS